jgi:hypothetical protein
MTDQETNDLILDYSAAAAKAIPYVGSIISVTILQFKTPEEVISWTDVKDYVDQAIAAATLQNDIQFWQDAIGTLMADLTNYQQNAAEAFDKTHRWNYLSARIADADKINQAILGKDGGEVDFTGLWRQSPFGLLQTVGQLLLINFTIFDEMKILVKLGQVPDGETGSSIQPDIKRVLTNFVTACKAMIPVSHQQRVGNIKVLADSITETDVFVPAPGMMPPKYFEYRYQWSDSSTPGSGINYTNTLKDPTDAERYAEQAKIAKYRVKWLDYWFKTHQEAVTTIVNQTTNVVDAFLNYDAGIYNAEIASRRSTGCVFGGAAIHVEINDQMVTDTAKGKGTTIDTVLYENKYGGIRSSDSRVYIPLFQYYSGATGNDTTAVTCWCVEKDNPGRMLILGYESIYSFYGVAPKALSPSFNMLSATWDQAKAYSQNGIQGSGGGGNQGNWKLTWKLPSLTA